MNYRRQDPTLNILIPIESCELTLSEVMAWIADYMNKHPEEEVFMDGDAYAIVSRQRGIFA